MALDFSSSRHHYLRVMTGEQIRTAREAAGMTQQQLADAVGVRLESVNRWECGRLRVRPTSQLALTTVLPDLVKDLSKSVRAHSRKSMSR